jgi:putative inorganic carbon (HCO3(-)) transporter
MFLLVVSGMILLAFNRLNLCISLWAWVSLLDPNYFVYTIAAVVPYNKVVAGLTLLAIFTSSEKKKFYCPRTSAILLVFLVILALSQFTALSDNPIGWDVLDKFSKMVLLNLLIVCFMRTRQRLHTLALSICLGVGFYTIISALRFVVTGGAHIVSAIPNWGDNNHVALIALMTIPILAYVRREMKTAWMRLGVTGIIVLFIICVISTNSRGGFLGLVVLALAGIASSRHKVRYFMAMVVAGVILVQAVPDRWTKRVESIETIDSDNSFVGRLIAWKMSTLIALDHPFLGGGPYAVQSFNIWQAYTLKFPRLSFIPTDDPDTTMAHAAHSIYFEVLGDTGFLGLFVFVCIIASGFREGSRSIAMVKNHPELQWAKNLAEKLRLSLLVFIVSGAALSAAYHDLNYIILAMLSTIHGIVSVELGRGSSRVEEVGGLELAGRTGPTLAARHRPAVQ